MTLRFVTPGRVHLAGIFTIAFAVLAYQVLLTRLFSVMLYYHFAFAGVSLVMLGLTIGAERVYLDPQRFSRERLEIEWANAALRFAVSSVVVVAWFIYLPVFVPAGVALQALIASSLLFVIPLVYSGICITLILTRSSFAIGKLYAADLIGAAAGAAGIVALLFLVDPISIFLGLAALSAASAALMAPPRTSILTAAKAAGLVLAVACTAQAGLYLTNNDHVRVMWAKGKRQENILFERWNAISRIRVVPLAEAIPQEGARPFGWGFGHAQTQSIEQLFLDIDADAATVLTRFDGSDLKPFAFLGNDVVNMAYHIRPVKRVAVIGVGGGRDVMSGLYFGAQHVTGIEMNPTIFEVLTKRFGDFTGHLERRPDVSLVNAEARSWINQSRQEFDLIQVSLIDTWAATAAGGLTMSENKIYTMDAWKDFLARLTPDGMLEVSRWFDPVAHKAEFYRLLSLAADALQASGVPKSEVQSHIMAFSVNRLVVVVVSRSAFSPAEVARARDAAAHEGFQPMIDGGHAWDPTSALISSGRATSAFYDGLASDLTAPTDNRPFFFYTWKPLNVLFGRGGVEVDSNERNNLAVMMIEFLLVATFLSVLFFIVSPLRRLSRQAPVREMLPLLGYFAGIGLGFMLIEISQMQRLMVFLGDPVFGLTVVLFSLLLFGGLGSFSVGPGRAGSRWMRPALCLAVLCAVGVLTPYLAEALKASGVVVRVVASVALLAPAGFCMGMMFPTGMLMSGRYADQQAWFWGVNGATSVFASVLGMAVSMEYGIAEAYWAGVACYSLCLLFVVRHGMARTAPVAEVAGAAHAGGG